MTRICGALLAVMLCSQLAQGQDRRPFGPPGLPPAGDCNLACNGKTFLLIANGVSENLDVQERLSDALEYSRCQPIMRNIYWATLEYPNYNYLNQGVQILGAAKLAAQVLKIRQCSPASPIVLLGYCAGAHVVLLAAEQLPPGSVDRIILLSPSVSSCYDVRLAMRASKLGLDVFYSSDDPNQADKQENYGTAEALRGPVASRTGFFIKCRGPFANDPILLGLHQFNVAGCEFLGDTGEYTTLNRMFLRRYVLSLIPCGMVIAGGPGLPPPGLPPGPPMPPQGPYPPPGPPMPPQEPYTPPGSPPGPNGPPVPPPPGPPMPPLPSLNRTANGQLPPVLPAPPLNRTTGPTPPPPFGGPPAPISDRTPPLPPLPPPAPPLPPA